MTGRALVARTQRFAAAASILVKLMGSQIGVSCFVCDEALRLSVAVALIAFASSIMHHYRRRFPAALLLQS